MPKKAAKKSATKNKKESAETLTPSITGQDIALIVKHKEIVDVNNYLSLTSAPDITTPNVYESCNEILKEVKRKGKALDEKLKSITSPLNQSLKAARELFKSPADQLKHLEHVIKTKMGSWLDEQERIRQEAIAVVREKAAEAQRVKDLAEKESREKAQALAAAGKKEEAEEESMKSFLESQQQAPAPAPVIPAPASTGTGSHRVTTYHVSYEDKNVAIRSLLLHSMLDFIEIKMNDLNRHAASRDGDLGIEGFKVETRRSIRTRA